MARLKYLMSICLFVCAFFCTDMAIGAQIASTDPNRDMGSSYFASGNPYSPTYVGQCTWYVWGRCAESGWNIGFTGNASGFYDGVHGAVGRDFSPELGDIMCLPSLGGPNGHVAIVVQVIDNNTWVVDEFNVASLEWSRETVRKSSTDPSKVYGELFGTTPLAGFLHSPATGSDTDIWVDENSSGGMGTQSSPFNTINAAINKASATAAVIIHVAPGRYPETFSTNKHIQFVLNGTGGAIIGP